MAEGLEGGKQTFVAALGVHAVPGFGWLVCVA
jgi:hypothetical protein